MLFKYLALYVCQAVAVSGLVLPDLQTFGSLEVSVQKPMEVKVSQGTQDPETMKQAPLVAEAKVENILPKKYIVVFEEGVSETQVNEHRNWILSQQGEAGIAEQSDALSFFNIHNLFSGYVGMMSDELLEKVRAQPGVKFVEKDSVMRVNEFDVEKDAPWGLSRVSHRQLSPNLDYLYDNEGGEGVVAYVIDTGIKTSLEEFEGRAQWGEAVPFPKVPQDFNGHGTHCAGIIGSKTFGIAKKVSLVAVGVMNPLGAGSTSDIVKGVEFVVNDHRSNVESKKGFKGSVINMSLGGSASQALDMAVDAAVAAGIHVAVAAGNDNADACDFSPARANGPISVGASNSNDEKASFSNWGKCVDIFAPGQDILSTFAWGDTATMSGTSMASPHVAGLLSYFLSLQPDIKSEFATDTLLKPANLKSSLIKYGTHGVLTAFEDSDSPNIMAFNGAGGNLTEFW